MSSFHARSKKIGRTSLGHQASRRNPAAIAGESWFLMPPYEGRGLLRSSPKGSFFVMRGSGGPVFKGSQHSHPRRAHPTLRHGTLVEPRKTAAHQPLWRHRPWAMQAGEPPTGAWPCRQGSLQRTITQSPWLGQCSCAANICEVGRLWDSGDWIFVLVFYCTNICWESHGWYASHRLHLLA